jgi:hypothetical protein
LAVRAATLVAAMASAGIAHGAEPSAADKETGRALFAQGMAALDAHDYAGAERACRGAHAIVKVPTASTCLGRALEGLGRLVESRDVFFEAAHYPAVAGEPKVFTDARTAASAEADALAARIPSLLILVTGPPETAKLRATVDGAAIPADTVRLPRKVDPGNHVVDVSAPGFRHARVEVAAVEGQEQRVAVSIEPSATEARSSGPLQVEPAIPASAEPGNGRKAIALVTGGVGVASVVVGSVFGLVASSKWSSARNDCGGGCGPAAPAQGEKNTAASDATVSTVAFVVGGALAAGGVVLYLTAPSGSTTGTGLRIAPSAGSGEAGVVLAGGF